MTNDSAKKFVCCVPRWPLLPFALIPLSKLSLNFCVCPIEMETSLHTQDKGSEDLLNPASVARFPIYGLSSLLPGGGRGVQHLLRHLHHPQPDVQEGGGRAAQEQALQRAHDVPHEGTHLMIITNWDT